ncbi:hypothetical protein GJ744_003084 [Endocarpon pusillum]|uniref:Uncharacterized protein n=1 Tax=Endocarpon pusillum TaxID=364733 RepID=A0A8H7ARS6_9EURO|nr:hypothetical protein GJ744_003084 [Endocarpon pusillum]
MPNGTIGIGDGTSCDWSGNPDLYGPGIRIGLYLQWFATIMTTALLPEKEVSAHSLAMLMHIAVFAGLGFVTTGKETNSVEIIITLWLLVGPLPSLSWRGIFQLGTFAGIARPLLYSAFGAYGCWFWFTGAYRLPKTPCTSVAFWGSTSVTGWFSKLGQAISIVGIVAPTVAVAWSLGRIGRDDFGLARESQASDDGKSQYYTRRVLFCVSLVIIVFAIATVEHLIRVNHVVDLGDISSVGQLVPLITGTLSIAFCLRDVILKLDDY